MKPTKTIVINVKLILILSSLFLLFGCNPKEKQEWSAAMSRPFNYISSGQHVFYFKEGKIIGSCATLTDIGNFGWAFPQSARTNGYIDVLPDSVVVDYLGLTDKNEMWTFRGGMSLPTKLMDSLFKAGYIKNGKHEKFESIITGLAPGGRICVWIDHVEIKRGIVPIEKKYFDYPVSVFMDSIEINNYFKHHPVDYSIWDKPEPLYELGFGYCSEDNKSYRFFGAFVSREGIYNTFDQYYLDKTIWGEPANRPVNYKGYFYKQLNENIQKQNIQLPVHIRVGWEDKPKIDMYTQVVLPKDFEKRFTTPYKHPDTGKLTYFHRLVFGIEKDGEHCVIWLDGPDKQEKLMRFKGELDKEDENGKSIRSYAREIIYY